ncbi:patatin-like phospholipase family protein [Rhodobacteraceae bacterium CCMM004]|nr:patatin-like phospholipase family protein [Rhodobacteraceae bacterium CCMM004]
MGPKRINLALQGGGAHGAFTWGVLDVLLACEDVEIAAISGTSAGALNGAALKSGLVAGGRAEARATLAWLWGQIGAVQDMRLASWLSDMAPATRAMSQALEYSLPYSLGDIVARATSPYAYGPFYRHPLERIVRNLRFDEVCAPEGPDLHVCATNVRTGKIRVFSGDEIGPEALLASACLPTLFQAVEIAEPDGTTQAYWDGGYTGNPALHPLYDPGLPDDIVVVNINPIYRPDLPYAPQEILNRINEISFNASLLRDLRAIAFVKRLIAEGKVAPGAMKDVAVHMIADDTLMRDLSVATKVVPSPVVLARLKSAGEAAAQAFLDAHLGDIGVRGTVDLEAMFG